MSSPSASSDQSKTRSANSTLNSICLILILKISRYGCYFLALDFVIVLLKHIFTTLDGEMCSSVSFYVLPMAYFTAKVILKAVDTIGNCQRLAFIVGVSQHMHEITNL